MGLRGLKHRLVPPILAVKPGGFATTADQLHAVVISFPGSGRTWLRMMLARVFELHLGLPGVSLEQLAGHKPHPRIPLILYAHDDYPQWKKPEELEQDKSRYRNESVLFIARDPRDILVSNYFQKKSGAIPAVDDGLEALAQRVIPFAGTVEEFVDQEIGGLDSIISYLNTWNANKNSTKKFLQIRYEDLSRDTVGTLKQVLRFLGFSTVSESTMLEAVNFGSLENMRSLEARADARLPFLMPGDQGDPQSYKTRRGQVGGFTDYLSPDTIVNITNRMRQRLSPDFGY